MQCYYAEIDGDYVNIWKRGRRRWLLLTAWPDGSLSFSRTKRKLPWRLTPLREVPETQGQ